MEKNELGKDIGGVNEKIMKARGEASGNGKENGSNDKYIFINEENSTLNALEDCMQGLRSTIINGHNSPKLSKGGMGGSDASTKTAGGKEKVMGLQNP